MLDHTVDELCQLRRVLGILTVKRPFSCFQIQRVRDWIHDFFSSLPKLCDDPSNIVAAAAFSAIEALLREHPLCETAVDKEVRGFWGLESDVQAEGKGGVQEGRGSRGTPGGMFGGHKQVWYTFGDLATAKSLLP